MTVELIGDDRAAPPGSPLRLRNGVACRAGTKWRADGSDFLVPRGMAAQPTGEESCGRPLRKNDRGAAVLRSDMSNRGRVGRARVQTDDLAMRPSVIGGICRPTINTPAAVRTLSFSIRRPADFRPNALPFCFLTTVMGNLRADGAVFMPAVPGDGSLCARQCWRPSWSLLRSMRSEPMEAKMHTCCSGTARSAMPIDDRCPFRQVGLPGPPGRGQPEGPERPLQEQAVSLLAGIRLRLKAVQIIDRPLRMRRCLEGGAAVIGKDR